MSVLALTGTFAAAAIAGVGLWLAAQREARLHGGRVGSWSWRIGMYAGIAAAALAMVLPLRFGFVYAVPITVALGIAVTTDLADLRVYDAVCGFLLAVALIAGVSMCGWAAVFASVAYGAVSLCIVLFAPEGTLGLADVWGIAFLGALFGWRAWEEIMLAFVLSTFVFGVMLLRERRLTVFPFYPGIAIASLLGMTVVIPRMEAFVATLV